MRRPINLAIGNLSLLAGNLEPNLSAAIPRSGSLALGHLGHVELDGARMPDGGARLEAQRVSGFHRERLGRCAGRPLVAADSIAGNVLHGACTSSLIRYRGFTTSWGRDEPLDW